MNTYEPTSIKSEKLPNFIKEMTSIKDKNEIIEESKVIEEEVTKAPINMMHPRLLSLFYKIYFILYKLKSERVKLV